MRTSHERKRSGFTAVVRWGLAVVLALSFTGIAKDEQAVQLSTWSDATAEAWWQSHSEPDDWIRQREAIVAALREAEAKRGLDNMASNPTS